MHTHACTYTGAIKKILFFYFFLNYGAYSSLSNRRYKNSVVHGKLICARSGTQLFFIFYFFFFWYLWAVSVSCEFVGEAYRGCRCWHFGIHNLVVKKGNDNKMWFEVWLFCSREVVRSCLEMVFYTQVLVLDAGKMICKQTHHLEQSHETYHCGG